MREDDIFENLKGKTIKEILNLEEGSECVSFKCSDGTLYQMYHTQDCCENVMVEDVEGDINDLIGHEILKAEEVSNADEPLEDYKPDYSSESFTWTFYKLATIKGYVTIRWLGESNGWYGEGVEFYKIQP